MQNEPDADHPESETANRENEAARIAAGQSPIEKNACGCPHKKGYFSKPENWVGLLTLLAVGAYTVITFFMWCNSNRQLAISKDTEHRSLRAYMIITDFGVACPDCGDIALSADTYGMRNAILTRFENNGQTPAFQVEGITNWLPEPKANASLPKDFAFADHKRTGFVSKSDIGRDKHKDSAEEITDQKDIAMFKAAGDGQITMFLYGHVDYCDIFGEPHSVAFCFIYKRNAGLHLPICDRYNGEIPAKGTC
ncbi:MAG: hypothetical protein ACLQL2_06805 [Methylovirgula sp.]